MKPIRVIRIASVKNDRHGGMSRTMYLTGDFLEDQGFELRYVFSDRFEWPLKGGWTRFSQPFESGVRACAAAREWNGCDIVEVHEPLALGCCLARTFCGRPWRVVAFSYGIESLGFEAMLHYRAAHGVPVKLKSLVAGRTQCAISLVGLRLCDHVICSNQKDVEHLASEGFPLTMLTRHFSGVDDQMLQMGRNGCSHGSGGIVFLGTWIDRKGIWDLVPAVSRILRERPGVFFTAAGCLVEDDEVLRRFPDDVRGRVKVVRRIDRPEELAAIYRTHSVLLLPSYFEGQPLVMMEAAAFGLAIVTTPVCGMLDFIRDGQNGVFVPVGDPNAIHRAVTRLLELPDEARRLGAAARKDVEYHTWRASAQNLGQAYRTLLSRP